MNEIPEQEQQQGPPMKKRKKQAVRVVKVTSCDIFRFVGQDITTQLNQCKPTVYPLHKILWEVTYGRCYKVETTY